MRSANSGPSLSTRLMLRALADRQRRQVNDDAALGLQQSFQRSSELLAALRIAPRAAFGAEMEAARLCRHPQLAIGHVAIDDDAAPVGAFDRQHAVVLRPVEVAFGSVEGCPD